MFPDNRRTSPIYANLRRYGNNCFKGTLLRSHPIGLWHRKPACCPHFCPVAGVKLRSFQSAFVRGATAPGILTAAYSLPCGNGKSWLAARMMADALTPEHPTFQAGTESVLVAASYEQARVCFRFVRQMIEGTAAYKFQDAANRIGITHPATGTRCRVIGSDGRTAMGLVQCPLVVADEPGSWHTNAGQLVYDAIVTAQGKPGSPLRAVFIGTMAPYGIEGTW